MKLTLPLSWGSKNPQLTIAHFHFCLGCKVLMMFCHCIHISKELQTTTLNQVWKKKEALLEFKTLKGELRMDIYPPWMWMKRTFLMQMKAWAFIFAASCVNFESVWQREKKEATTKIWSGKKTEGRAFDLTNRQSQSQPFKSLLLISNYPLVFVHSRVTLLFINPESSPTSFYINLISLGLQKIVFTDPPYR